MHDAKAAVRWLRARAAELTIDPDRIAAWGESAGGHLAELLGLTTADPALEGQVGVVGPSSSVTAVAAWYAPSDIGAVATDLGNDPTDPSSREAQLLGAAAPTVPELAGQASPISHVTPTAPPFLLLHGGADRMIPGIQSERLHAALVAAGVDAELHLYPGANHMWLGAPDAATDAALRTIAFLQRHFRATLPDRTKPQGRHRMRIVGIEADRGGEVQVAALSEDGAKATVIAGLDLVLEGRGRLSRPGA